MLCQAIEIGEGGLSHSRGIHKECVLCSTSMPEEPRVYILRYSTDSILKQLYPSLPIHLTVLDLSRGMDGAQCWMEEDRDHISIAIDLLVLGLICLPPYLQCTFQ